MAMNKKNRKNIPVPDPDSSDMEYVCPSASWGDMTGLIPANNSPETISEEYEELYPYLPTPEARDSY
ncbi:MAG: hypothetical protein J6B75_08540 [Ruminococcus sp.]|nr:hypothetical protein [Ruminococcus sp.]